MGDYINHYLHYLGYRKYFTQAIKYINANNNNTNTSTSTSTNTNNNNSTVNSTNTNTNIETADSGNNNPKKDIYSIVTAFVLIILTAIWDFVNRPVNIDFIVPLTAKAILT